MIIPVLPLSVYQHRSLDFCYDFVLKCIKQFFCSLLSRIYSISFSSLHLLPSGIWTHCVYIRNFSCYSTSNLPHKKLVFVYYSISVGLLLTYIGAIVLKWAKKTVKDSLSDLVVWLELECLKNKNDPPRLIFINYWEEGSTVEVCMYKTIYDIGTTAAVSWLEMKGYFGIDILQYLTSRTMHMCCMSAVQGR